MYTYERTTAWGTTTTEPDVRRLATDIALALGLPATAVQAYNPHEPDMPHDPKHIALNDTGGAYLNISVREWRKSDIGKAHITIGHPARRELHYTDCPPMPECKVTMARGPEAMARTICRKVIEPARPIIAAMIEKQAARQERQATLQGQIDALRAAFPALSVENAKPDNFSAQWHGPHGLRGAVSRDGTITVESRLPLTVEQFATVLQWRADASTTEGNG